MFAIAEEKPRIANQYLGELRVERVAEHDAGCAVDEKGATFSNGEKREEALGDEHFALGGGHFGASCHFIAHGEFLVKSALQ